ncbi:hypothetical protein RhiJN_24349 [Ceratobasidium sp. AG-Ba]|nr:hypothetical protein RhiJN_24349 [Ceratobasidium sp. AG-Ba]
MSSSKNSSGSKGLPPVVYSRHAFNRQGGTSHIQRKGHNTSSKRSIVPQTAAYSNSQSSCVPNSTAEQEENMYFSFDDCAGEEIKPIEETPQSSSKSIRPNVLLKTWVEELLEAYVLALHYRDAGPYDGQMCTYCQGGAPALFRCKNCPEAGYWQASSLEELGLVWSLGHGGAPCESSAATSLLWVGDVFGFVQVRIRYCAHSGAPIKSVQLIRAGLFPCSEREPQSAFTLSLLAHFTLFSTLGKISGHRYNQVLKRQTNPGFPARVIDRYRELLIAQRKYAYAKALKRSGQFFKPVPGQAPGQSLAIHCVACPRVGVNFNPGDVIPSERPLFQFFISHDGNFRNTRKAKKFDPEDVFLTDGQMYFVEQAPFKDWVAIKKKEKPTKRIRPECDNHKAAVDKFARWGGLDVTGIGACTCARHSLFLPAGMVDFDKGERLVRLRDDYGIYSEHQSSFANVDYAIASASRAMLVRGVLLLAVTYDIFCHWFPGFMDRVKHLPPQISFDVKQTEMNGGLARWHAAGHEEPCRVRYSLNYMQFVGRIDGEGCERAWAAVNETAGSTSEKTPGGRGDSINFIVDDLNFGKITTTTALIVSKFKDGKRMFILQGEVFEDLDRSLPVQQTLEWRQESTKPRKVNGVWTSVFFGKNDWGKSVHDVLQEEKNRLGDEDVTDHGENHSNPQGETSKKQVSLAKWISKAIELENTMDKLRTDASLLKANDAPQRHNAVNNRRKMLLTRITAHRQEREFFLGSLGDPDHPSRDQPKSSDVEDYELGLPSSYLSSTLIAENGLEPARVEGLVRRAACDDALKIVRNLLGAKSLALRKPFKELRAKTETACRRYNRSRDALLRLDLQGSDHQTYLSLEQEHLKMLSEYLDDESGAVGQGSRNIAWIWRTDLVSNSETWMIDALKVEWFRARQRARQWEEELMILKREIVMTLKSFQYEQGIWAARSKQPGLSHGMSAYALKKSKFFERLALDAWTSGQTIMLDPIVNLEWASTNWPNEMAIGTTTQADSD